MKNVLAQMPKATWFMIIVDGKHDLYLNNERDEIIAKYAGRKVKRYVGMGCEPYDTATAVKIELV